MSKQGIIIVGSVVVLLVALLALPITVPYSVTAPGRVLSKREWVVAQGTDGRITTRMIDRAKGVTNDYTVSQFERGDAVEFSLNSSIGAGSVIHAGDTIGVVRSSATEQELTRLRGELATSIASLALNVTGEKQSVVEEAKQQIERSQKQSEVRQAILERQKSLFERGMVSQQEYELTSREASLASIDIEIAKARLRSVTTGVKKEQVEFIRTHMQSLQREINVLERRRSQGSLVSPLTGIALNVASNDTLLIVSDTSEYVIVMPVRLRERSFLSQHQSVVVRTRELGNLPDGIIASIDNTIYTLNGEQIVFATAVLSENVATLLHGLPAQCGIVCTAVTPREYVARSLRTLLN